MSTIACTKSLNFSPSHTVPAAAGLVLLLIITFAGSASADAVTFGFAVSMGGTGLESGNESGRAIALDSSGNVYTTGWFTGTADFDPGEGTEFLTSSGGEFDSDIFVTKLDSSGNFVWAKAMGGPTWFDEGSGIVVDASANVYITGMFSGTADFNPGEGTEILISAGGDFDADIFVCKLDSSGSFVWARSMGGTGPDEGFGIGLDTSGNVYTTGKFTGTADFDPGEGTENLTSAGAAIPPSPDADIFVSKLNSAGNFVWARAMGGTEFDEARGIVVDASDNLYTAGRFKGTADFDPGEGTLELASAGDEAIFVTKLNSAGNLVWAKAMGGTGLAKAFDIAVDASGSVYTTGEFLDSVDFNPGTGTEDLTSVGVWDIFVSKLDSAGDFVWAKKMGGTSDDSGFGIALDASDNVYTTGRFAGTVDFDPGTGTENLSSASGISAPDIFVSKLDSAGNFVWAKHMGGGGLDLGLDIVVDASDNVYTTGHFQSTADFDPGAGTVNLITAVDGGLDIFVSKLTPIGELVETWVDFGFVGSENGSEANPFNLLAEGLDQTAPSGIVKIKGDTGHSVSNETMTIDQLVTIEAVNGTVRIGEAGGRSAGNSRQSGFISRRRDQTRLNP